MSLLRKFKNIMTGNKYGARKDFSEASSSSKNALAKFAVKAVSLIKGESSGSDDRETPDFDLAEIKAAHESDSYIKMAFMKYSSMLFKAGYQIKSENEAASEYVKLRLYIMSFSTSKPIEILFQEVGDDLLKYSNAFLVKSRVKQIMNGVNAKGFLSNQPVGGYFRIDPATISIERDASGAIKKYVQEVDGKEKSFAPTEVVHYYLDKDAASAFGTPRIQAALEDIKLLRRVEGQTVAMIHRYAMPLYQWIIGLAQPGYQATNKEIDEAKEEIERMTFDGTVVTNEKTKIEVVGAQGNALSIGEYLTYFEQRAFTAIGVSAAQMGRAGAKQDADAMEAQAHDIVKHIQKIFSIFTDNMLINELLFEGGFDPINKIEDRTFFEFNEVNLETKLKLENHVIAKFQSNLITFEEARRGTGNREEVDETRLYKNAIEVKAELDIAKARGDESIRIAQENAKLAPKVATGTGGGNGTSPKGNGATKSQAPTKTASSKDNPSNQHGKTSVKVKESLDIKETQRSKDVRSYKDIFKEYHNLKTLTIQSVDSYDENYQKTINNIMNLIKTDFNEVIVKGTQKCITDAKKIEGASRPLPNVSVSIDTVDKNTRKSLEGLFKDIKKKIRNNPDDRNIIGIFEAMEYRLRFILQYSIPKVYWIAYCATAISLGYENVYIDFDGSKDEEEHEEKVSLKNLKLSELPPYHPYCDCKIYLKEEN